MKKKEFNDRLKQLGMESSIRSLIERWDAHKYVKTILMEYSGGGCYHLMFHMVDGRIINVNIADENVEISYYKWNSIPKYYAYEWIDDNACHGFGYEYLNPFYDERTTDLSDTSWVYTQWMLEYQKLYK